MTAGLGIYDTMQLVQPDVATICTGLAASMGAVLLTCLLYTSLYVINEGKFTKEEIEKDFDAFVKLFTWNYLQKYFIKQDNLTVTPEEATAEAKALAQAQFCLLYTS